MSQMASEKVVIQSPMSFVGSTRRIWKITDTGPALFKIPLALMLLAVAWIVVAIWTLTFGLLLVPYRLLRRGGRKRKQEALRHREALASR